MRGARLVVDRRTNTEHSMNLDNSPGEWSQDAGDNLPDKLPSTEAKGQLVPPPRKPPTAVAGPVSGPEPGRHLPAPRMEATARSDVSRAMLRAVDNALDMLDSIGDALRAAAARVTS
jgi:hypothetical protein